MDSLFSRKQSKNKIGLFICILYAITIGLTTNPASSFLQEWQQSSIVNLTPFQPAFALTTPTMKTTTNNSSTTNTNYDISVEKTYINNNTIVKKGKEVLYNGPDATFGIQLGIKNLAPQQQIYLYNGSYSITKPLNFTTGMFMHGQG